MKSVDEAILEELNEAGIEYPTLIASRRGFHINYVEERCRVLASDGLIEVVSREVTYRITDRGIQYLNGDLNVADLERDQ